MDPPLEPSLDLKKIAIVYGGLTGLTGFEPATSAVTGRCSDQLNYSPNRSGYQL